jgi:phospholipid/cholesterol/gamma-HCH transport system substrate-binding protein
MNNAQMSARVGLFFLLGLALTWVTFEALGDGELKSSNAYELTAPFTSLKELKPGDEVRMAGVRVGRVLTTRLNERRAEAVLLIDNTVPVARDAVATIAMAGLLGSNYVSLTLGSDDAGALAPGSRIKTVDTADLNTLVAQLGDIGAKVEQAIGQFSGFMGGAGAGGEGPGLIAKLDQLVEENRTRIGAITTDLADVTATIRRGEGTLGKLVYDESAYQNLVTTLEEIRVAAGDARTFLADTRGILDQVKSGQGALGALLYDPATADRLKLTVQNLSEVSTKLNSGEGTLGRLIADDSLFLEAQGTLQKVNRAVDGLADQGPITAVGAAASALF